MILEREDLLILNYCIDGRVPEDIILSDTASKYLAMPNHGLNANESKLKLEKLLSGKLLTKEISSFDNSINCGITEKGGDVIETFFHPNWQNIIGIHLQNQSENYLKVTLTSCDLDILKKYFSEARSHTEHNPIIKKCSSWQPVYWKLMSEGFSLSFKLANTERNIEDWSYLYAIANGDTWIDSWDEVEASLKTNACR